MKKAKIDGVCKIEAYRSKDGEYSTLEINGMRIEALLVDGLLGKETNGDSERKISLCKISIAIDPHTETLMVNGVEMPLEL